MKFKIGDRIIRGPGWITGIILDTHYADYLIQCDGTTGCRTISISFIDDLWRLDEEYVIDRILEKYA